MSIPVPVAFRIRWILAFTALGLLLTTLGALSATADAKPGHRASVIVQMDRGASPERVMRRIRWLHGKVTRRLPIINGFAAELDAGDAAELARDPDVKAVTPNSAVEPQSVRTDRIQTAYPFSVDANLAWNTTNVTGKDVGVAVIDTGIAGSMPDFDIAGRERGSRVVASVVTNPLAHTAADTYGHGTHVAGILAGNGNERSSEDYLDGKYVGIAPDADLVSIKVSDDLGNATVLDVIYGLQFAVDHKADYNIRVVNLSLESSTPGSYRTDPLDAAVEAAWFKGLVVVAAAGNRGSAADAVSYAPGNDPYVISVGAIDDDASRADGDDARALWSSRGVTQDGVTKPEIHAPGAHIVSTLAAGSAFATMCPTCIVSGKMIRAGGTSMSAPVVSGVVALLLQKYPNLTPNQVKGVLIRSSRLVNNRYAEVDAYDALRAAAAGNTAPVNGGLVPNDIVDPATGDIDYTRSSWSRSSWSTAPDALTAGFARSSWSCACSLDDSGDVEATRSSWSRSSWSTSWTK